MAIGLSFFLDKALMADSPLRVHNEKGVESLEYSGFRFVREPS